MIKQATPRETAAALEDIAESVYLDVRTEAEFAQGHPAGAYNVPIMLRDETGAMVENPEFVEVVRSTLGQAKAIFCGCQMGGRSTRAVSALQAADVTAELYNVAGGFGGGRHPDTGAQVAGWKDEGLPVETETNARGYASLRERLPR